MSARLIGGTPDSYAVEVPVTAGTAIQAGDILDKSGNVVQRATASSTMMTLFGVAAESISTAATAIKVTRFVPGQTWSVDTKNNTATNQLFEGAILQDHLTIDNTSSAVTGPTGVFTPFAFAGQTTDKILIGNFSTIGATTA